MVGDRGRGGRRSLPGDRPTTARRSGDVTAARGRETEGAASHRSMPGRTPMAADLRAVLLNCTLKRSPSISNTQALMRPRDRALRRPRRHLRERSRGRPRRAVRHLQRRGRRRRVAADPGEDPGRGHHRHRHADLVRGARQRGPARDRAPRRDLRRHQRGRPVPALQQGRRRGGDRQRGRRPRCGGHDPLQPLAPGLHDPAERRHLLGGRRRPRPAASSSPTDGRAPTPARPAAGWPTTRSTWPAC